MSRRRNIMPTLSLHLKLPSDVHTRMTLHLYSELEGRVPFGAHQRFISELINDFFERRTLSLAPWTSSFDDLHVSGSPASIVALEELLGEDCD